MKLVNFDGFEEFCKLAATNDDVFKSFKHNPIYTQILEHVSTDQALMYIDKIKKLYPEFLADEYLNSFSENDKIGSPILTTFNLNGKQYNISNTVFRYINVLVDLIRIFGNLDGMEILEIGAGNCGQANIISKVFNFCTYDVIDLPGVMELQKRCVKEMNLQNTYVGDLESLDSGSYDLVISNYAFSECPGEVQENYLRKFIIPASKGYLTMNFNSITNYKEVLRNELQYKNVRFVGEDPQTSTDNYICIWG